MNFIDGKEERHMRVAQIAVNMCKRELLDPTEALYKAASQNALNPAETEDVCAKLNHILFREKFAEDKLAVFNAAKYDRMRKEASLQSIDMVTDYGKINRRVRENILMKLAEITGQDPNQIDPEQLMAQEQQMMQAQMAQQQGGMPQEQAPQGQVPQEGAMPQEGAIPPMPMEDPIMDEASERLKSHEFSRFMEQTAANASEISAHHMAIDNIVDEMKNRIVALFREGVPLEDVYSTILTSVGESQAPAIQEYFMKVIEDLKAQGLIPEGEQVHYPDAEKVAADFCADEKLAKMAMDIKDNTDMALIKEAMHEACLDALTHAGKFRLAEQIDKNVESTRYTDLLKQAGSMGPQAQAAFDTLKRGRDSIGAVMKEYATPLAMGAGAVGAGAALKGTEALYQKIKMRRMKKKLPNMYPELKDIDKNKYGNIYDTLVNLNPGIMKAPWALSEAIKKYNDYGTIDIGNILDLQRTGQGSASPFISDIAVKPTQNTIQSIINKQLNPPRP